MQTQHRGVVPEVGQATVLLLGVGGQHGSRWKLDVVRRVRESTWRVVVVEADRHWSEPVLKSEIQVHHVILLPEGIQPDAGSDQVISRLEQLGLHPGAVITYRQEWLRLRALLAETYAVRGPSERAVALAADKFRMKLAIRDRGLNVPDMCCVRAAELSHLKDIAFPIFVRPNTSIRSEWAREVRDREELQRYAADVARSEQFSDVSRFLVETLLVGHEVDVDVFLEDGDVVYGRTSDNFPGNSPFALETGHLMPSLLPEAIQSECLAVASEAVRAAGFRNGNMHVELMVLPDRNVYLLEVNGRLGGMYIADWHRRIWGVDLVMAELVNGLGYSAKAFLECSSPTVALAQLSLSARAPQSGGPSRRVAWLDPSSLPACSPPVDRLECWYNEPQEEKLAVSGPLNLGSVTIRAGRPQEAFELLAEWLRLSPLKLTIDEMNESPDASSVARFGLNSPLARYRIRSMGPDDSEQMVALLRHLSPHAEGDDWKLGMADPETQVLCMHDSLRTGAPIVATIGIHLWRRLRPGLPLCAYLHDLVVLPEYRSAGLGHRMLEAAEQLAAAHDCYKIYLDCDPSMQAGYEAMGYHAVGPCMVRYPDDEAT